MTHTRYPKRKPRPLPRHCDGPSEWSDEDDVGDPDAVEVFPPTDGE